MPREVPKALHFRKRPAYVNKSADEPPATARYHVDCVTAPGTKLSRTVFAIQNAEMTWKISPIDSRSLSELSKLSLVDFQIQMKVRRMDPTHATTQRRTLVPVPRARRKITGVISSDLSHSSFSTSDLSRVDLHTHDAEQTRKKKLRVRVMISSVFDATSAIYATRAQSGDRQTLALHACWAEHLRSECRIQLR
jgi:hypothetical protein